MWEDNPIRFLIIDFALVGGLDFSSAEAFVRIQRLLAAKDVLLILCGAEPHGLVGTALRAVDLWADEEGSQVEVFRTLNEALEWTENCYLTAFYDNKARSAGAGAGAGGAGGAGAGAGAQPRSINQPSKGRVPFSLAESFQNSPRRTLLARAGDENLQSGFVTYGATLGPPPPSSRAPAQAPAAAQAQEALAPKVPGQPLQILRQTIAPWTDGEAGDALLSAVAPYFAQIVVGAGDVLWRQGDASDGLYLIEQGSLRATYAYDEHAEALHQTMVAGTIAGDLSTLSETPRNATVVAERDCVLWKLTSEALGRMQREIPDDAARFVKVVLKGAVEEVDVLSSHMIAVLV